MKNLCNLAEREQKRVRKARLRSLFIHGNAGPRKGGGHKMRVVVLGVLALLPLVAQATEAEEVANVKASIVLAYDMRERLLAAAPGALPSEVLTAEELALANRCEGVRGWVATLTRERADLPASTVMRGAGYVTDCRHRADNRVIICPGPTFADQDRYGRVLGVSCGAPANWSEARIALAEDAFRRESKR